MYLYKNKVHTYTVHYSLCPNDNEQVRPYLVNCNLPVIHPAATDEDPWRADLALITHSGAHPSTILIDVKIAAHNSRAAGRASLPGCAAMLPKLPHMPATIVLPLMMCSFSSSQ